MGTLSPAVIEQAKSHPFRQRVLARLSAATEPVSPAMFALETGKSAEYVRYHFEVLAVTSLIDVRSQRHLDQESRDLPYELSA